MRLRLKVTGENRSPTLKSNIVYIPSAQTKENQLTKDGLGIILLFKEQCSSGTIDHEATRCYNFKRSRWCVCQLSLR